MNILRRCRRVRGKSSGLIAAAFLLVLTGSAPRVSTGHCEMHGAPAMAMHHLGHHPGTAGWEAPPRESCHHCLPYQCAALAPCNNAGSIGLVDCDPRAVEPFAWFGTPLPGLLLLPSSPSYQPPIPPPRSHA